MKNSSITHGWKLVAYNMDNFVSKANEIALSL